MSRGERVRRPRPRFGDAWADLIQRRQAGRLLVVVFLGTMAFNMQDVLLEPYGGEILGLSVSSTTLLTATWALGALAGFALAAKWLAEGINPYRMGARGILAGLAAFSAVIFSNPWGSAELFFVGACLIGFGGGLFSVATLTAAMTMPSAGKAGRGLALGAWGAAQATAAGLSIAIGGAHSRRGSTPLAHRTGQLGRGACQRPRRATPSFTTSRSCFSSSRWWPSGRWYEPQRPIPKGRRARSGSPTCPPD
jgi:BCD family chlorophyll transporter-like MFS transporter